MFSYRPFSINYLGNDGTYNFFVNIGNVNEIIYGFSLQKYLNPLPLGEISLYHGIYDPVLTLKDSFVPTGEEDLVSKYLIPIKKSVSLTESGSIYLKVPKIPAGSGRENCGLRPAWFSTRADFPDSQNLLVWDNQFEIVSTIDEDDLFYTQRNDVFETQQGIWDPNLEIQPKLGATYIKLADINIIEDSVTILPFFQSNIVNPNRFFTMGINFNRNIVVNYVAKAYYSDTYSVLEGQYSRLNWTIMSRDEIFSVCKNQIEEDFLSFSQNWELYQLETIDNFEVLQLFSVYMVQADSKIHVKKIFEAVNDENLFTELGWETIDSIIPGLNIDNTILEN